MLRITSRPRRGRPARGPPAARRIQPVRAVRADPPDRPVRRVICP